MIENIAIDKKVDISIFKYVIKHKNLLICQLKSAVKLLTDMLHISNKNLSVDTHQKTVNNTIAGTSEIRKTNKTNSNSSGMRTTVRPTVHEKIIQKVNKL